MHYINLWPCPRPRDASVSMKGKWVLLSLQGGWAQCIYYLRITGCEVIHLTAIRSLFLLAKRKESIDSSRLRPFACRCKRWEAIGCSDNLQTLFIFRYHPWKSLLSGRAPRNLAKTSMRQKPCGYELLTVHHSSAEISAAGDTADDELVNLHIHRRLFRSTLIKSWECWRVLFIALSKGFFSASGQINISQRSLLII